MEQYVEEIEEESWPDPAVAKNIEELSFILSPQYWNSPSVTNRSTLVFPYILNH